MKLKIECFPLRLSIHYVSELTGVRHLTRRMHATFNSRILMLTESNSVRPQTHPRQRCKGPHYWTVLRWGSLVAAYEIELGVQDVHKAAMVVKGGGEPRLDRGRRGAVIQTPQSLLQPSKKFWRK